MRKLDRSVRKNGFHYNLIERTSNKAIYSQGFEGKIIGHEVFKIEVVKETVLFGKAIPEREKFPSDNDFGVTAWSCGMDLDKAMQRYNELE